eukprot:TRINITY_DN56870_c0_g1_i1.p1 TRINITY_DN56870_c0_g1~~TRINITY_DN56870_c0_g1_i1.p1  ORF type:complete len:603 (-),score=91.44 TRINITY_DN56870_c0_g1_i1:38-1846(-)
MAAQALDLGAQAMNLSINCRISCDDGFSACASGLIDSSAKVSTRPVWASSDVVKVGLVSYISELDQELIGPPLREGEVWHYVPEEDEIDESCKQFHRADLTLYANGFAISPFNGPMRTYGLSPFSLVQACRMHSVEADQSVPWLRLFKVSIFQHGSTHFFAMHVNAEMHAEFQRSRWVADISRTVRILTQSLFPSYMIRPDPLPGRTWTDTRLLAGYLLLCDDCGVSLVYGELHAPMNNSALFTAYEDETCDTQVVRANILSDTCVTERVGVDCGCFSLDGYHFAARTCSEKIFWLRAISNVKVKIRHESPNPTPEELAQYRAAIREYAKDALLDKRADSKEGEFTRKPLLQPRNTARRRKSASTAFVAPGWLGREQSDRMTPVDTIGPASNSSAKAWNDTLCGRPKDPFSKYMCSVQASHGSRSSALPPSMTALLGKGLHVLATGCPQDLVFPDLVEACPPKPEGMEAFWSKPEGTEVVAVLVPGTEAQSPKPEGTEAFTCLGIVDGSVEKPMLLGPIAAENTDGVAAECEEVTPPWTAKAPSRRVCSFNLCCCLCRLTACRLTCLWFGGSRLFQQSRSRREAAEAARRVSLIATNPSSRR